MKKPMPGWPLGCVIAGACVGVVLLMFIVVVVLVDRFVLSPH
jgi:hypothetical protein